MDDKLKTAVDEFMADPPVFARAGKGGKFPMGAMKLKEDKSSYDILPLTHACTQNDFDKICKLVSIIAETRA